jgi:hypothetical protein
MHSTGLLEGTRLTGSGLGPGRARHSRAACPHCDGRKRPPSYMATLQGPCANAGFWLPTNLRSRERRASNHSSGASRVGRGAACNTVSRFCCSSPAPLAWTVLATFDPAKFGGPATRPSATGMTVPPCCRPQWSLDRGGHPQLGGLHFKRTHAFARWAQTPSNRRTLTVWLAVDNDVHCSHKLRREAKEWQIHEQIFGTPVRTGAT